ncbi:MAG: TonB-dependent receptor [Pseudomonadales bacterium]|nr:TonB-dependent receptor [Pseudomonadales bacterium]
MARERRRALRRDRHEFGVEADGESRSTTSLASDESALLMRHVAALPERERLVVHAYYFEEQNSDSQSVIREDLSGYQNTRFGLEPIDDEISILNLTANMETSWVDLVYSFSSYDRDLFYRFNIDVNLFSANPTNGGAALIQPQDVDTDVHELRFVSNADGPLKWTTGIFLSERNTFGLSEVYYRNESGDLINLSGGPGSEGDPASIAFRRSVDQKQTERAIYGEVSYDFTDNTTLTFGARIFEFENDDGGAALVSPVGIPANAPFIGASSEHDGEVFKLKLSHNILDDSVVYLNWSQGFRAGGANVEALTSGFPIADTPETFEPDTVDNYEIGFRGALMDGRLTLATALFYLDWQDMFVDLERNDLLGNIEFRANAGEAEITGLEFETEVLLAEDFKVSASFTVIDGELASDVRQFGDSAGALAGDTLPFQPDMTFNLSAEYGWAMANLRSYIWAGYRYVGESSTDFHPFVIDSNGPTTTPNPEYTEVGDYGILSLRYGLEGDDWNGAFYIDNATDERECTFIRITGLRPPPGNCFVERPLTAGIRFSKDF